MDISNLDYYVKFVFILEGKDLDFPTSDIKVLKEVIPNSEFKIGQEISFNDEAYVIKDIYVKDVNETTRSNDIGWSASESQMQGDKKESLVTIVITVEELQD